jgi:deazaflavin-dependent oxidoreductase (nitroreductase family)
VTGNTTAPAVSARRATTPYAAWVTACLLAETVGMTAAATAARLGEHRAAAAALALVVAGGLVEGLALGAFQSAVLGRVAPALRRGRYVVATTLVAGLGWAAAAAPGVLGGQGGGTPSLALVLLSAAGLGLATGALLGAAQALTLRGAVRRPARWVTANAVAWPGAMAVVFLGATTPEASWPTWGVIVLGAATGAVAGGVLGAVSCAFLGSLDGPSLSGRVVLALLRTHHPSGLRGAVVGLEVRGRRSGRAYRLPVMYAVAPGGLAVVPGRAPRKTWWRNLGSRPTPVGLLREGVWAPATAVLLTPDEPTYEAVLGAYRGRWPRTSTPADQPVVLVRVGAVAPRPAQ